MAGGDGAADLQAVDRRVAQMPEQSRRRSIVWDGDAQARDAVPPAEKSAPEGIFPRADGHKIDAAKVDVILQHKDALAGVLPALHPVGQVDEVLRGGEREHLPAVHLLAGGVKAGGVVGNLRLLLHRLHRFRVRLHDRFPHHRLRVLRGQGAALAAAQQNQRRHQQRYQQHFPLFHPVNLPPVPETLFYPSFSSCSSPA